MLLFFCLQASLHSYSHNLLSQNFLSLSNFISLSIMLHSFFYFFTHPLQSQYPWNTLKIGRRGKKKRVTLVKKTKLHHSHITRSWFRLHEHRKQTEVPFFLYPLELLSRIPSIRYCVCSLAVHYYVFMSFLCSPKNLGPYLEGQGHSTTLQQNRVHNFVI